MTYRNTDPETSKIAGTSINTAALEAMVLRALSELSNGTTHELSEHLGLALVTVSPRMAPLERKGLVQKTGIKRMGQSGTRPAIVWKRT